MIALILYGVIGSVIILRQISQIENKIDEHQKNIEEYVDRESSK